MRMPAEWAPHERTLIAWPCRESLWGPVLADARRETATLANAIADFEPVLMVCPPRHGADARAALGGGVVVWEAAIDDSWLRDSGPIFRDDGSAVQFGFNAWGGKFPPWEDDATIATRICEHLGRPAERSEMVLEGGAISVDGSGTLITTEQCLLNPNRNPGWHRERIEDELRGRLGVERVVWLEEGLAEDRDTDGHVDLVAAFAAPGRVLLLSVDVGNANFDRLAAARGVLEGAGIEVLDLPGLRYTEVAGERTAVSPANLYVANGAVFVAERAEGAEAALRAAFPGREVVPVPADVLAYGGGGPHCVTQQVPAGT
jgi:agmatine deiminase